MTGEELGQTVNRPRKQTQQGDRPVWSIMWTWALGAMETPATWSSRISISARRRPGCSLHFRRAATAQRQDESDTLALWFQCSPYLVVKETDTRIAEEVWERTAVDGVWWAREFPSPRENLMHPLGQ